MTKSIERDPPSQIRAVRRFNRFYAQALEVMEGNLLPGFSVGEMRILYELAHRPNLTASDLTSSLHIDPGYLSRLLARMVRRRLLTRTPSEKDARNRHLNLSKHGKTVFNKLDRATSARIAAVLGRIPSPRRRKLVDAMQKVGVLLGDKNPPPSYIFRHPRAGDFGWIVYRHGTVIAQEFGWDERFEALVARIVGEFVEHYDPTCDRCWVVEYDAEVVGSVFLVREDATTAKLRLLYVEPTLRGAGIGRKLVDKAVAHAAAVGFTRVLLWTTNGLDSARKIYESAGFQFIEETPNNEFASSKFEATGQVWELRLSESLAVKV